MNEQGNEKKLVEGEDFYYTPEGYKCFTSNYHLKRGYCCKSGCRHCPYGFDKKTGGTKKWEVFASAICCYINWISQHNMSIPTVYLAT